MSLDAETNFYVTKGIMTLEETKKLNDDRECLDLSLLIGVTTNDELYDHIQVEIDIFLKSLQIFVEENNQSILTKLLLVLLLNRINNMFAYMFFLFPVNAEYAEKYLRFCINNLPFVLPP